MSTEVDPKTGEIYIPWECANPKKTTVLNLLKTPVFNLFWGE